MAQVLVRGLDHSVVDQLKQRAHTRGLSLEAELRNILQRAAGEDVNAARNMADKIRRTLKGRRHTDSADLLAEDRSR